MNTAELQVVGASLPESSKVLTPQALAFLSELFSRFEGRREELLAARKVRQQALDRGEPLRFLSETKSIRDAEWKVASIPADLQDRRVEITGPVD
ncbi:MAG: malate synthase A, partial [Myxococcaceae bacterium]